MTSIAQFLTGTHQRHEVSLLHDGGELLASVGAGANLLPEQVAGGQVSKPVLGHDLVALGALAAPGSSQHPHDGQLSLPQGGLVNVSSLHGLKKEFLRNQFLRILR